MKTIPTEFLVPGMTLAEDIILQNGQIVARHATVLTDEIIARLEHYKIESVKISTEQFNSKPTAAPVEEGYSVRVKKSENYQIFSKKLASATETFSRQLTAMLDKEGPIQTEHLYAEIMDIIPESATTLNVFDLIHNTRQHNDPIYAHSINVSLICNILGQWLGFSEKDTQILTVSGLLHDIGKNKIPESILNKPGKLSSSEFEIIKNHPIYGHNLLKNRGLDKRILNATLQHHERCDGSGYPNGLKDNEIDTFAKIVAIADVYDAMTSSRDFRSSNCPFKVVALFEQDGLGKYDTRFILTFLERIVLTYMHNTVQLSDGRIGEVVMINKLNLSRPIVKIGDDFIDLSQKKDLTIQSIV